MATTDYKRVCDVCGDDSFLFRQLTPIGDGKYACPYDSRGFSDADLRGRNDMAKLWPAIKPRQNPGSESSIIPLYRKAEAEVLNLLLGYEGTGVPPYRHWRFSSQPSGSHPTDGLGDGYKNTAYRPTQSINEFRVELDTCAWVAIYLYELLIEDKRPHVWITAATAKFRAMADTLLENQFGSPTIRAALTTKHGTLTEAALNWGGIVRDVQYLPVSQPRDFNEFNGQLGTVASYVWTTTMGAAGVALLRAHAYFGDKKYRDGYMRIATWLHRSLNLHCLTTNYTSTKGGGRIRYPTWPEQLQQHTTLNGRDTISRFPVECLACLEFLTLLKAKEGDIAIGSAVSVTEFSTQPGTETISTVMALVKAFWRDGIRSQNYQQNYEGKPSTGSVSGFNGTCPYDFVQVAQGSGNFEPYWSYRWADQYVDQTIGGMSFVHGMRGWYAAFGFDETLQAVWNFLMATTQTADMEIPAGTTKEILSNTCMGPYTPASMGIASMITVQEGDFYGPLNYVGTSRWTMLDVSALGLLADLWVEREPAGFALAKERACTLRRRRWVIGRDQKFDLPALMRYVGFSYQTIPSAITNHPGYFPNVAGAAPINLTTYNFATDTSGICNLNERAYDACGAAMFGLAFRRQPKIYSVKDHHPRH